jgi:hypothetical protein
VQWHSAVRSSKLRRHDPTMQGWGIYFRGLTRENFLSAVRISATGRTRLGAPFAMLGPWHFVPYADGQMGGLTGMNREDWPCKTRAVTWAKPCASNSAGDGYPPAKEIIPGQLRYGNTSRMGEPAGFSKVGTQGSCVNHLLNAAVTMISTSSSGAASLASQVARIGTASAETQASQAAFRPAKSRSMSLSQICALRIFSLLLPTLAS